MYKYSLTQAAGLLMKFYTFISFYTSLLLNNVIMTLFWDNSLYISRYEASKNGTVLR